MESASCQKHWLAPQIVHLGKCKCSTSLDGADAEDAGGERVWMKREAEAKMQGGGESSAGRPVVMRCLRGMVFFLVFYLLRVCMCVCVWEWE